MPTPSFPNPSFPPSFLHLHSTFYSLLYEVMTTRLLAPDSYGAPLDTYRFSIILLCHCHQHNIPLPSERWVALELAEFHEGLIRRARARGARPPEIVSLTTDALTLCLDILHLHQLRPPVH